MGYIGQRVRRVEDSRFLRGEGRYTGDLRFADLLHVGFVRSPHPHARIMSIDGSKALALTDVHVVHTCRDLPEVAGVTPASSLPPQLRAHGYCPLACETVRYVGEPVAVVLARNPEALADALDLVEVEYEVRPAIASIEDALRPDAPLVWDDVPGNVALETSFSFEDAPSWFGRAPVVLEDTFTFARSAGAALEPRTVVATCEAAEPVQVTIWDSTQAPHNVRDAVAAYLGLENENVRVVTPDVGGGFGPKGRLYPEEYVLAALAMRYRCPVSFTATRTEDLLTTAQGGGQIVHARLAAREDGTLLAIDHHIIQDAGAYTPGGLAAPMNTVRHIVGPYRVPAGRIRLTGVYTNRVMTCPLRGGGRQNGTFVMERLLDRLSDRLSMDRATIRRRNFIPPDAYPYDTRIPTTSGATVIYDSGSFSRYLDLALESIAYGSFAAQQEEARSQGRYLGIGLAAFTESTGVGQESSRMSVSEDGTVELSVGSPSNGQGHATAFAQLAAERFGVPLERIRFVSGDTGVVSRGTGTFASRMGQSGGNAVSKAAVALRHQVLAIASNMLEIAPQDLEIVDGRVTVKGVTERFVELTQVAAEAVRQGTPLQSTGEHPAESRSTWAGGVDATVVEVDPETGQVTILRYVAVHDCGTIVNPIIVDGQVHGGVIHGIGNALLEESSFDNSAYPSNPTFVDYLIPSIGDVPMIETTHVETPSPFNDEGIKGAGEGGTIGAISAVISAVEDALRPFNCVLRDVPLQRELIVQAVLNC